MVTKTLKSIKFLGNAQKYLKNYNDFLVTHRKYQLPNCFRDSRSCFR